MYATTKKEILDYLIDKTASFQEEQMQRFTANAIAEQLSISRSLASQYLNELVKEREVVKINSRPVYFLHLQGMENRYDHKLSTTVYVSLNELKQELTTNHKNFEKAIGATSGLSACIEQCKAAMKYPPKGLPVLLVGASGTGKAYLAHLMYEYCLDQRLPVLPNRLLTVNCNEYINRPERMLEAFFGKISVKEDGTTVKRPGAIAMADQGLLLIKGVHHLTYECQEKLVSFMDNGRYRMVGDSGSWHHASVKFIFTTDQEPKGNLSKDLLRMIPVVVPIPTLEERTLEEKEEMILTFFQKEALKMGYSITISSRVFQALSDYSFAENIGELKSCISKACAKAFLHDTEERCLRVHLYHLPNRILSSLKPDEMDASDEHLISLDEYKRGAVISRDIRYLKTLLADLSSFHGSDSGFARLLDRSFVSMNAYHNYLVFNKKYNPKRIGHIETVLKNITTNLADRNNIHISANCVLTLSRCLYVQNQAESLLKQFAEDSEKQIAEFRELLKHHLDSEYIIAEKITALVKQNLGIQLNHINFILLVLNLKYYNKTFAPESIMSVIICHGYSTASSLADAANKMIGSRVFDAIDMPLELNVKEVVVQLKRYLQQKFLSKQLLIMVDMGSLEDIGESLQDIPNLNIGIINNVSTLLAVDIGLMIRRGLDVKTILENTEKISIRRYKFIANQTREEAIIFTSESGSNTAMRMKELFDNSLPKKIPLKLLSCDFFELEDKEKQKEILSQYEVLAIAGIFDPKIGNIPFIALGDIINFKATEVIDDILAKYLTVDEIDRFNANLLKNFSLQNVVQSLTILNPDKILDSVEEAMTQLQRTMGRKLTPKTLVGLYIHLCCFIERLVTKRPIKSYGELAEFTAGNQQFIQQIEESFAGLISHYMIELPVSEIAYIYEYIKHDEDVDDNPDVE